MKRILTLFAATALAGTLAAHITGAGQAIGQAGSADVPEQVAKKAETLMERGQRP